MRQKELPSRKLFILNLAVVVCSTAALWPVNACGDGVYYPEQAYKVLPAIPNQRVIIVYKDGVEKLIIESSLNGQGKEFGWIIPLPSRPTEFEKVSPGFLETLSSTIQPYIIHTPPVSLGPFCIFAGLITLLYFGILFLKLARFKTLHDPIFVISIIIIIGIILFMPPLNFSHSSKGGGFGSTAIPSIKVLEVQAIGSYELSVLEADSSEALEKWLTSNGFTTLTSKGEAIISDYIRSGWCFVAAKLRREAEGYSLPHPLAMSFTIDKPIYPMRLTAMAGGDVYLELFVIADKQATSRQLPLEVCDIYRSNNFYSNGQILTEFWGRNYYQDIGHSDSPSYMWNRCYLSKMCGTLMPEDMKDDIAIELKSKQPYRRQYYSKRGAKERVSIFCLKAWLLLLIILTLISYKKLKQQNSIKFAFTEIVLPLALFLLLVWGIIYTILPKVEAQTKTTEEFGYNLRFNPYGSKVIAHEYDYLKGLSKDEFILEIADFYKFQGAKNIFTGQEIKQGESPGNYMILEDKRGIVFKGYFEGAFSHDYILSTKTDFGDLVLEPKTQEISILMSAVGDDSSKEHALRKIVYSDLMNVEYLSILIKFYRTQPKQLVPIVLADLRKKLKKLPTSLGKIEYEVSMLGCITRTEPPLDVRDRKKMKDFMAKAEQWYNSN